MQGTNGERKPEAVDPRTLVAMDLFPSEPIEIDLVYADAGHPENIFETAAYHGAARLSLHQDLAGVVLHAARKLQRARGWTLILKDGLRPVEAQQTLINTDIVRTNPHWLEEPRLLSSPGQGAHPRGMAIDVSVRDSTGEPVNMGTAFDAMVPESARSYQGFGADILANRKALEEAFVQAGAARGVPILPLPSEWWDFRIPSAVHGIYAPIFDADLPAPLRLCNPPASDADWEAHMRGLAKALAASL
jgi:D-alanyl-D-alanine dipeptidase